MINSVPRPEFEEEVVDLSAPVEVSEKIKLRDRAKMMSIMEVNELDEISLQQHKVEEESEEAREKKKKAEETKDDKSAVLRERQVQFDVNLILNEVGIIVNRNDRSFLRYIPTNPLQN